MKKPRLSRRGFLRGAAGTIVGLPLLEFMMNDHGTAHADDSPLPCRYFNTFCPTSLVVSGSRSEAMTPSQTGYGYSLTPVLSSLGSRGVLDDVSVVSGLFCAPLDVPGGYNVDYHGQAAWALYSGQRSGFSGTLWRPQGISADEAVALATEDSVLFRKLYFQIDPSPSGKRVSFEQTTGFADEDPIVWEAIQPEVSPANAYNTLFSGFRPPGDTPDPAAELDRRLRLSSLSYAGEQIAALNARLGASDKRRLDEHLTHIRELEGRLLNSGMGQSGSGCADPNLGPANPADLGPELPDQDARADLFADLIQMALACDLTRSVTLGGASLLTGSGMRHELWGHVGGLHGELQHGAPQAELDLANGFFVDVYARVLQRLEAIPEGAGTLLDETAAVFMMEGGKGLSSDAQRSGDGGGDSNHSCDNMVAMIGGRAGGLVPGRHLDLRGQDLHPTRVFNSALRAVGLTPQLGEIAGDIPQLFTA